MIGQRRDVVLVSDPLDTFVFSSEPTERGDQEAQLLRDWYEANRETWWQRRDINKGLSDDFMLGLMARALLIHEAAKRLPR